MIECDSCGERPCFLVINKTGEHYFCRQDAYNEAKEEFQKDGSMPDVWIWTVKTVPYQFPASDLEVPVKYFGDCFENPLAEAVMAFYNNSIMSLMGL